MENKRILYDIFRIKLLTDSLKINVLGNASAVCIVTVLILVCEFVFSVAGVGSDDVSCSLLQVLISIQ